VVAQLARALEATHAAQGVHRDVKGANLLVEASGLRAFLTDFGAGNYAGAARLTREGLPPGTDTYRSPEAWAFALHCPRNSTAVYEARPADDVFALGVSAYRLVTGVYPPPMELREEEEGPGRLEWPAPAPPSALNPRVDLELSALILRALSTRPEDRPTARELAEALEAAVRNPAPGVDRPLRAATEGARAAVEQQGQKVERERSLGRRTRLRAAVPSWVGHAASAMLGGVIVAVTAGWALRMSWREEVGRAVHPMSAEPSGLGDTGLGVPSAWKDAPDGREGLRVPMPDTPLEGQRRAALCSPPVEIAINGGCWVLVTYVKPPCGERGYEWKGSCYFPSYQPPRKPTSEQR
jgi:hypothetical protein